MRSQSAFSEGPIKVRVRVAKPLIARRYTSPALKDRAKLTPTLRDEHWVSGNYSIWRRARVLFSTLVAANSPISEKGT